MLSVKVSDAVPLDNAEILVFFEDGKIKKFDIKKLIPGYPEFAALLDEELFCKLKVEPGGYGISWTEDLDCSEGELYNDGTDIPLSADDFRRFAEHNLVSTKDACEILGCTKQNIDDLIKRDKLHPIKFNDRYKLFFRNEIEKRTW